MTRKHFVDLVEVLVDNNADDALIHDIAILCKRHNRNFDFTTWWDYVQKRRFEKNPINELV